MAAPAVPYYGKDTDRLAMLTIAFNTLSEREDLLKDWPATVPHPKKLKEKTDIYEGAFHQARNFDRRAIAQRVTACNDAGVTWQKIVNYLCAMETDNTALLEQMGVGTKSRRSTGGSGELAAPDLSVVNVDEKGVVRASCSRDRRRYTYCMEVTEGDPRIDEGWYHKASFGDCTEMIMSGFRSGKEYSFRCRIIGRDNKVGPWSHVIRSAFGAHGSSQSSEVESEVLSESWHSI